MPTITADQRDTTPMHQPTTVPGRAPARGFLRAGMTIMEIMVAFAIIAIAMSSLLGMIANLSNVRKEAPDVAAINHALVAVVDRIQAAHETNVGSGLLAPRFLDSVSGSQPPLTESASSSTDNLVSQGICPGPLGLNLRIYIEYYRGVAGLTADGSVDTTKPGLMDGEDPSATAGYTVPADFASRLSTATNRALYRLSPSSDVWSQVGENDPLVIRVLAVYALPREPTRDRTLELFTGRKK